MTRKLAALALTLALSACTEEGAAVYEASTLDEGDIAVAAEDAWATVGVEAPTDYSLFFLDGETLADACDYGPLEPGTVLGGCAPTSDVVILNAAQAPEQQTENLIHEVGHLLRGGRRGHLRCGPDADAGKAFGSDVMCLSGRGPGGMPTLRDAAFVR